MLPISPLAHLSVVLSFLIVRRLSYYISACLPDAIPPGAEFPNADAAVLGPGDQEGCGGVKAHRTAGYGGTMGIWDRPAQRTGSRIVAPGGGACGNRRVTNFRI